MTDLVPRFRVIAFYCSSVRAFFEILNNRKRERVSALDVVSSSGSRHCSLDTLSIGLDNRVSDCLGWVWYASTVSIPSSQEVRHATATTRPLQSAKQLHQSSGRLYISPTTREYVFFELNGDFANQPSWIIAFDDWIVDP